jgi:hypothetical protein
MKPIRIKQRQGKSHIDLEPFGGEGVFSNQLNISVSQWSSDGVKSANVKLDLLGVKQLLEYLERYVDERKDELAGLESKRMLKRSRARRIFETVADSGRLTQEQVLDLKELGAPIIALLAKDLSVPANEVTAILAANPLPSAFLKKHYDNCLEHIMNDL